MSLVLLERDPRAPLVHPIRHPGKSDDVFNRLQTDTHLVSVVVAALDGDAVNAGSDLHPQDHPIGRDLPGSL